MVKKLLREESLTCICYKISSHENATPVGGHVVIVLGGEILLECMKDPWRSDVIFKDGAPVEVSRGYVEKWLKNFHAFHGQS